MKPSASRKTIARALFGFSPFKHKPIDGFFSRNPKGENLKNWIRADYDSLDGPRTDNQSGRGNNIAFESGAGKEIRAFIKIND